MKFAFQRRPLTDPDGSLFDAGQLQEPARDALGDRLQQVAGFALDDLAHQLVGVRVVDRLLQAVAAAGGAEVALQLHVDGEARAQLLRQLQELRCRG